MRKALLELLENLSDIVSGIVFVSSSSSSEESLVSCEEEDEVVGWA